MLFNSAIFLQFFAAVLLLYYCVRGNRSARNALLLAASYLFYGWWDYRFLTLLLISSLLDFFVGLSLGRLHNQLHRKILVSASIAGNLSILGFFKYYDFFVDSAARLLAGLGYSAPIPTLGIILPVGISFYTFQTMSYAIDVYRGELKPSRDLIEFLTYVSFFPQLVAGPIERGKHLLPQFGERRLVTKPMLDEGIWLCVWGMFKKVVLADNLAPLVEMTYNHSRPGALMIVLGTVAFGFQIYCDFSGYSDIARGTARILGFDIMWNFHRPYFASNLRDFWRRWHISLSTWLRDYLYISLGGNRSGTLRTYQNLFLTMLLGGLWHGAAWNFIAWGAWHGGGLVVERVFSRIGARRAWPGPTGAIPRTVQASPGGAVARFAGWVLTMLFVFYGWLLFRAGSWHQIVTLTRGLADFISPVWTRSFCLNLIVFTLPLILMELWQAKAGDLLVAIRSRVWVRALLQGTLLVAIAIYWQKEKVPFIYFQF